TALLHQPLQFLGHEGGPVEQVDLAYGAQQQQAEHQCDQQLDQGDAKLAWAVAATVHAQISVVTTNTRSSPAGVFSGPSSPRALSRGTATVARSRAASTSTALSPLGRVALIRSFPWSRSAAASRVPSVSPKSTS